MDLIKNHSLSYYSPEQNKFDIFYDMIGFLSTLLTLTRLEFYNLYLEIVRSTKMICGSFGGTALQMENQLFNFGQGINYK